VAKIRTLKNENRSRAGQRQTGWTQGQPRLPEQRRHPQAILLRLPTVRAEAWRPENPLGFGWERQWTTPQYHSVDFFQSDAPPPQPSAGERSDSEPLGQAPPDVSNLFQSQSSILLKPGEIQLDVGFTYSWQESNGLVVLPGNVLAVQRLRDRRALMPLSLR
jgi:hypothetical protein